MLVAGGLYLDGNPAEKVIGHGRTDGALARLRISKGTIHVSVDRDLTHKAGLLASGRQAGVVKKYEAPEES